MTLDACKRVSCKVLFARTRRVFSSARTNFLEFRHFCNSNTVKIWPGMRLVTPSPQPSPPLCVKSPMRGANQRHPILRRSGLAIAQLTQLVLQLLQLSRHRIVLDRLLLRLRPRTIALRQPLRLLVRHPRPLSLRFLKAHWRSIRFSFRCFGSTLLVSGRGRERRWLVVRLSVVLVPFALSHA